MVLGLSPFLVLEAVLSIFDVGRPTHYTDPFVGFSSVHPLFELDETRAVYVTALSRQKQFGPQQFAAEKPANGFRVFCLGGSTVRGRPYETDTAFTKWLELELSGSDSTRQYEVVNCGGVSYASYRLMPVLEEVLRYRPDLIVIATGHNEFLEDRTYHAIKSRSAVKRWLDDHVFASRTMTLCRQLAGSDGKPIETGESNGMDGRAILADEVDTLLDQQSGYASYHRDDKWRKDVLSHYEQTVRAMVAVCRRRKVPLILINLGSNLRDCPPFKSQHKRGLSTAEEAAWQQAFDAASKADERSLPLALAAARREIADRQAETLPERAPKIAPGKQDDAAFFAAVQMGLHTDNEKLQQALKVYREAEAIDDQYALLAYRTARCLDRLGRADHARKYYIKAKDLDVCPLRMLEETHRLLMNIADETGVPLLDARRLLERNSPEEIPGLDWYIDHVHPTIAGHQQIARGIARTMREQNFLPGTVPWSDIKRRAEFRRHFQELGPAFLTNGRRRVGWLEGWAQRRRLYTETLPVDPRGFLHFGQKQLDFGRIGEAWHAFRSAAAVDPPLVERLLDHALALFEQGRTESARLLVDRLQQTPKASKLLSELQLAALVIALEEQDQQRAALLYTKHLDDLRKFKNIPNRWLKLMPSALARADELAKATKTTTSDGR